MEVDDVVREMGLEILQGMLSELLSRRGYPPSLSALQGGDKFYFRRKLDGKHSQLNKYDREFSHSGMPELM